MGTDSPSHLMVGDYEISLTVLEDVVSDKPSMLGVVKLMRRCMRIRVSLLQTFCSS